MKTKYTTIACDLLQSYHAKAKDMDELQLLKLNAELASHFRAMALIAQFNGDFYGSCDLYDITMMAWAGNPPSEKTFLTMKGNILMNDGSHTFVVAANKVLAMYIMWRGVVGDNYQYGDEEIEWCCQQLISLRHAASYAGYLSESTAIGEALKFRKLTGKLPESIELHVNVAGL